ncbi:MFS transporter [Actinoallomurus vinaceus]|uniref:MFS transporter n=1 Tax=Actinoallomurus vinaceus TaxID=1080074 RepID=A0ABP8UGV1_9ACTN
MASIPAGRFSRLWAAILPDPGPARLLALTSLLGSFGFGLYQSGSAIYFVRSAGMAENRVGLGLSLAGLAGLVFGILIGHLADRHGPRGVAIAMSVLKAAPLAVFPWVHAYWQFLLAAAVFGIADGGWSVANEAIIAGAITGSARIRASAYLRSVFNVGITAGAFCAGLALTADTRTAYLALFWGCVLASLTTAVSYLRLPRLPGVPPGEAPVRGLRAVRDLPYLAVAQISNVSLLSDTVLFVGLPLWLVSGTSAPRSLAAWLVALNTLLVVGLQVRAARSAETPTGAVRTQQWAFCALIVMCLLAGLAGYFSAWPASGLLVVSVVALTAGEMWGQGSRWALRFAFAPAGAQGQYGAAFRLGQVGPRVLGPVTVTALTSRWHFGGWLVLAAVFVAALAAGRPVISWAERTRAEPRDEPQPVESRQ